MENTHNNSFSDCGFRKTWHKQNFASNFHLSSDFCEVWYKNSAPNAIDNF